MKTLTVKEMIEILSKVEDQEKPVYVYIDTEIVPVYDIDLMISDRVDINL